MTKLANASSRDRKLSKRKSIHRNHRNGYHKPVDKKSEEIKKKREEKEKKEEELLEVWISDEDDEI